MKESSIQIKEIPPPAEITISHSNSLAFLSNTKVGFLFRDLCFRPLQLLLVEDRLSEDWFCFLHNNIKGMSNISPCQSVTTSHILGLDKHDKLAINSFQNWPLTFPKSKSQTDKRVHDSVKSIPNNSARHSVILSLPVTSMGVDKTRRTGHLLFRKQFRIFPPF